MLKKLVFISALGVSCAALAQDHFNNTPTISIYAEQTNQTVRAGTNSVGSPISVLVNGSPVTQTSFPTSSNRCEGPGSSASQASQNFNWIVKFQWNGAQAPTAGSAVLAFKIESVCGAKSMNRALDGSTIGTAKSQVGSDPELKVVAKAVGDQLVEPADVSGRKDFNLTVNCSDLNWVLLSSGVYEATYQIAGAALDTYSGVTHPTVSYKDDYGSSGAQQKIINLTCGYALFGF